MTAPMPGPLKSLKIVEMAGLDPGLFAVMRLADHGADSDDILGELGYAAADIERQRGEGLIG